MKFKPSYLTFCIQMSLKRPDEMVVSPSVFNLACELWELEP